MAKGHRSQIKRARNENNRETRPSAKLSYARISVQKACYVLDAIRGKDVKTALAIVMYNPRYASSVIEKLLKEHQILKENEIPATFFLQGQCLAGNEEIVRRMHAEGHLIGNHTFHHVQLTKVSEEEAREEVVKTNNAIYEITGEYPVYIRPPFGEWREGLDLVVTMIPVLWDVDSRDWESQNTASICSEVLPNVKDGSIILMHDGYRATVEALRRILKELKEEGYTFVTVRELIEE